jgi:cytochrome bd ubiquinol oxidase subunit I
VSTTELAISLTVFLCVYALIGVVYAFLMLKYARRGLELEPEDEDPTDRRTPALTY